MFQRGHDAREFCHPAAGELRAAVPLDTTGLHHRLLQTTRRGEEEKCTCTA